MRFQDYLKNSQVSAGLSGFQDRNPLFFHVDGFRFDEGSILSLDTDGKVMKYPPVIWQIELDDALGYIKVIAEAWDAAALNQVGYFPGPRWAEWNGYYRDEIRRFVRGDPGLVRRVASRIAGSPDLYQFESRLPINSVNFVTCHGSVNEPS